VHCCRIVDFQDTKCLQALWTTKNFANDSRALVSSLVTVTPQARDVQQDVGYVIVGNNEAIPLRSVEPLYCPRDLEDIDGGIVDGGLFGVLGKFLLKWRCFRRHAAFPR
jgi:hypothetical protein